MTVVVGCSVCLDRLEVLCHFTLQSSFFYRHGSQSVFVLCPQFENLSIFLTRDGLELIEIRVLLPLSFLFSLSECINHGFEVLKF